MLDAFLNRVILGHEVVLPLAVHQHFGGHHVSGLPEFNLEGGNIKVPELVTLVEHLVKEFVHTSVQLLNVTHCHLPPHVFVCQVHARLLFVNIARAECVEHRAQIDQEQYERDC